MLSKFQRWPLLSRPSFRANAGVRTETAPAEDVPQCVHCARLFAFQRPVAAAEARGRSVVHAQLLGGRFSRVKFIDGDSQFSGWLCKRCEWKSVSKGTLAS